MPRSASGYGDANVAIYDQIYPRIDARTLDRLQELAGGRPVLELGVGTGRCARPLARRGLTVVGVDASAAMLARCRVLDAAAGVALVRADIANLPLRGGFGLACALVSTLALLPDRAAQRSALAGVAEALQPDGWFIDEGDGVADAAGQDEARDCEVPWPGAPGGVHRYRLLPVPAVLLDEYAIAAGMVCQARWRNWDGDPWRPGDPQAISIYRRTAGSVSSP